MNSGQFLTNDILIRKALRKKILLRYAQKSNSLILEELGLCHGNSRIDIALFNNFMHGYEIKSDKDNLNRLPNQVRTYSDIFDKVTLVVGYTHAYEALKIIPDWWGVKLVHIGKRGAIHFSDAKSAKQNPSPNIEVLASLLWRNEALDLLNEVESSRGFKGKSRSEIYKKLAEVTDLETIRSRVCLQLLNRTNWRSDVQQVLCGDSL